MVGGARAGIDEGRSIDRRGYILSTMAEGRTLLDTVLSSVRKVTEETLSPLSPSARRTLLRRLKKIC
ncbi:MAG: hypothetical protein ACK5IB_06905 [Qingshengfaniella sp.]